MVHAVWTHAHSTEMLAPPGASARSPLLCPQATPPNKYQVNHIVNQAYALVVQDSNSLNKYKGFSDQVYGEAGHDLISELIRKVHSESSHT